MLTSQGGTLNRTVTTNLDAAPETPPERGGTSGPTSSPGGEPGPEARPEARPARFGRAAAYCVGQALLIAGLFMVYRLGRQLAVGWEATALDHAKDVWNLQRRFGLPNEQTVQQLAMHSTDLVRLANHFYLGVHFPAALAFLVWVLVRHREHWVRVRNVLVIASGAALVIHILYPLAPPRFLPRVMPGVDLVDTGAVIGPGPYSSETASSSSNQFAAMTSLHVGWAILEAWGIVTILRTRARWLAVAQPVLTLFVVVLTANHYWLDGLVGGGLVAGAGWATAPAALARLRRAGASPASRPAAFAGGAKEQPVRRRRRDAGPAVVSRRGVSAGVVRRSTRRTGEVRS